MKKRLILISVISIILVISLLIGSTYSIFLSSNTNDDTNVYQTGNLDITYTLGDEDIVLSYGNPTSENEAMMSEPYHITISNVGNVPYKFNIILNDTTASDSISHEYIMTKVGKLESKSLSECTDGIIKSDVIVPANDSVDVDIRVYLGENFQNSEIGKSFYANLEIDGIAIYNENEDIDNSILAAPNNTVVTFNANGGTVTTTSKNVVYGEAYGELPTPTKEDYIFMGWYTAPTGGRKITEESIFNNEEELTLYARWIISNYTITFDPNGGIVTPTSINVTYGETYGELPTPTRDGYTFDGWYTEITEGTKITSSTNVSITENQTLYAHWTTGIYTVTFNPNGGSVTQTSKSVTYSETYGTLPTPTRDGYIFDGWYTEITEGTKITSSTTVSITTAQTLYAHWTTGIYTVTFNPNGGSVTPTTKTVTYGSTYGDLPTPTYTGYTFAGWYTTASGGSEVTSSTTVSITAAQTLYAHWTASDLTFADQTITKTFSTSSQTATVTAASNGTGTYTYKEKSEKNASGTATSYISLSGTTITIAANTPAGTYTYIITATDSNSGATKDATYTIVINKEAGSISYATTSVTKTYGDAAFTNTLTKTGDGTVTYSSSDTTVATVNSSTGAVTILKAGSSTITATVTDGTNYTYATKTASYTLTVNKATCGAPSSLAVSTAGIVTFTGGTNASSYQISIDNSDWSTFTSGSSYLSTIIAATGSRTVYVRSVCDSTNYSTLSSNVTKSVTVYAVTIQSNSTTYGTVNTASYNVISGATYTTSGSSLTFKGVTTGTTTTNLASVTATPKTGYSFSSWSSTSGTISAASTITATFSANTYTVTFNANGGTVSTSSKTVTYGGTYGTLPTPTYTGYRFAGWYTTASGGSKVTSSTTVSITAAQTLYAHWTETPGTAIRNLAPTGLSTSYVAGLYRFQGTSANNHICFGTSTKATCTGSPDTYMYRIIGINASGQIKVIKKTRLAAMQWNTAVGATWATSSLYSNLNGSSFYSNTSYVPTAWKSKIVKATWKYGDPTGYDVSASTMYGYENGWTTTVSNYIGLMYMHDYYYGMSGGNNCSSNGAYSTCKTSWIFLGNNDSANASNYEWFISRSGSDYGWSIYSSGYVGGGMQTASFAVRPVFYIVNTANFVSGTGTASNPFIIS